MQSFKGKANPNWKVKNGVIDRARTGDNQNHNLGLYQLSYDHRWRKNSRV
tara:strand:- start:162 stop:311 length:150 start_codon:yes stop_codon:yes gene_type:complete